MATDMFEEARRAIEIAAVRIKHQLADAEREASIGDLDAMELALGCAEGLIDEARRDVAAAIHRG